MVYWFSFIFIFCLGAVIGSFLNVLIDRIPRGENPLQGRSHCDYCHHKLAWYDLIPYLSFILLRGNCRYCHKFIGWKYPFIELSTACLFLATVVSMSFTSSFDLVRLLYLLLIDASLICIFYTDLFSGIIPDVIIFPTMLIAGLYVLTTQGTGSMFYLFSAVGALLFFLLLFTITKGRGMGFGDVKFSFLIGLILGWPNTFLSIYVAFLTGAAVAFILILWKKKKLRGSTIPFGPFLVFGTFISLFFGTFLLHRIMTIL